MVYAMFEEDVGCGKTCDSIIGECRSNVHCRKCRRWLMNNLGKTLNNKKEEMVDISKLKIEFWSEERKEWQESLCSFDEIDKIAQPLSDKYRAVDDNGAVHAEWDKGYCYGQGNKQPPTVEKSEQTTAGARHYTQGDLQVIDVIEAWDLNRNLAQVVAYILRCDHKGQRESDLEKAIDYLWRERYGTWATLPERTEKK